MRPKQQHINCRCNCHQYERWHRDEFGNGPGTWGYSTDIDAIEVTYLPSDPNTPIPVAIIEDKSKNGQVTRLQSQLYPMLSKALDVPFFVVNHNLYTESDKDQWVFWITEPETGWAECFNAKEYSLWLLRIRTEAKKLLTH